MKQSQGRKTADGRSPVASRGRHVLLLATAVAAAIAAPTGAVTTQARGAETSVKETGTLTFAAELNVTYPPTQCAPDLAAIAECFARTGSGIIRGLGSVNESYAYAVDSRPGCGADMVRLLPSTVRLSVAGKGAIEFRING